jgi:signal peptidase I
MGEGDETAAGRVKGAVAAFRESEHWAVALGRELLWVVAVVGGIALVLFLVSGTWPAVVAVESESMLPNMHVNDLVFVVQKDRFGPLQTAEESRSTGYTKFGQYGDVIIYRPNGAADIHPIIHRALALHDAAWYASNPSFPRFQDTRGGYLTQGDNNLRPDQQSFYPGIGYVKPVEDGWIVGKALFSVPLLGYPTLHYPAFAAVVILLLLVHEVYVATRGDRGRKEKKETKGRREGKKGKR